MVWANGKQTIGSESYSKPALIGAIIRSVFCKSNREPVFGSFLDLPNMTWFNDILFWTLPIPLFTSIVFQSNRGNKQTAAIFERPDRIRYMELYIGDDNSCWPIIINVVPLIRVLDHCYYLIAYSSRMLLNIPTACFLLCLIFLRRSFIIISFCLSFSTIFFCTFSGGIGIFILSMLFGYIWGWADPFL